MKPSLEELKQENDYEIIKKVPFDNLMEFLVENIDPTTKTMGFFYFFLVLCSISVIVNIIQLDDTFSHIFWLGLLGCILSFTIMVPVHEMIHGLVFKLFGAKKLSFGVSIKQMMFYATAYNFVMTRTQFVTLALAPFVVVTLGLLVLEWFFPGPVRWFCISTIFWHATMCIGDFAMLAFYEKNTRLDIYTFDDAETKTALFFKKK